MAYVGGRREKATLKYEKEVYTPEGAKTLSDHDLRKEYSRLRSIARKRLERFEGTEWTDTQVYQLNHGVYKPLSEIKSNTELRHLFSDVSRYVTASTSSVSGLEKQRREGVKTLHEHGYDFVTKENYRRYADFMEYARVANMNRMYDSKRVADYYDASEKKQLSSEEMRKAFRRWNKQESKKKKIQNINPRTSTQYRSETDYLPEQSKQKNKVDWQKAYESNDRLLAEQKRKNPDKYGYAGWNHTTKKKGDD